MGMHKTESLFKELSIFTIKPLFNTELVTLSGNNPSTPLAVVSTVINSNL